MNFSQIRPHLVFSSNQWLYPDDYKEEVTKRNICVSREVREPQPDWTARLLVSA